MTILRKQVIAGVKWTAVSFYLRRVLALVSNIIVARLLAPEDFGVMAMAAVAFGFAEIFGDLGTGSAIVQKEEISRNLLSTVFWLNVAVGMLATGITIASAPAIASFYRESRVEPVLRLLSISFLLSSLAVVQRAKLARDLRFDALARIEVLASVGATVTGISLAYAGFGIWSLVGQMLVGNMLTLVFVWYSDRWLPSPIFDMDEFRPVVRFSLNLTGFNILNFFARNADNVLIGRYLGSESLGYYDLAYKLMLFPLQGISAVFGSVMFPVYARVQKEPAAFRNAYLTVAGAIAIVSFPLMFGLMAVNELTVKVVLGPQWAAVAVLLVIFAPLGAIQSIGTTVGSIYQATGRTDLMLRWAIASSLFAVTAIAIGLRWGIVGVAISYALASLLLSYPAYAIPFAIVGMKVRDLVSVIWRPLACSLMMSGLVMGCGLVVQDRIPDIVALTALVMTGGLIYATFIRTWNHQQAQKLWQALRER